MTQTMAIALAREALMMTIAVAAPMMLVGLVVGLAVSILQTTTSIQEQALVFVPKILAILGSVIVFGPWMMRILSDYVIRLLALLVEAAPK